MPENQEHFCNSISAQVAQSTELATAFEDEACLTTEIMQYWEIHLHCQGSLLETNRKVREVASILPDCCSN